MMLNLNIEGIAVDKHNKYSWIVENTLEHKLHILWLMSIVGSWDHIVYNLQHCYRASSSKGKTGEN